MNRDLIEDKFVIKNRKYKSLIVLIQYLILIAITIFYFTNQSKSIHKEWTSKIDKLDPVSLTNVSVYTDKMQEINNYYYLLIWVLCLISFSVFLLKFKSYIIFKVFISIVFLSPMLYYSFEYWDNFSDLGYLHDDNLFPVIIAFIPAFFIFLFVIIDSIIGVRVLESDQQKEVINERLNEKINKLKELLNMNVISENEYKKKISTLKKEYNDLLITESLDYRNFTKKWKMR